MNTYTKRLIRFTALVIALLAINTRLSIAQEKKDSVSFAEVSFNKYANIYQLANQFNDKEVARMALYEMIMLSNNQTALLDTLALDYYSNGNVLSAVLVSKENLKINPNDVIALEICAIGFQRLGLLDKSLENYEKLYLKNNSSSPLYQMAFLQAELKRYKEASATIEILLLRSDIDDQMLTFNKADQSTQDVSMRAALLNLKGIIAKEAGDIESAKKLFLEAIQLAPGFELAQLNLKNTKE